MKNKNELLKSMSVLRKDLYNFITELENFEHNNNIDIKIRRKVKWKINY